MFQLILSLLVSLNAYADTESLACEKVFSPHFLRPLESPVEHGSDGISRLQPGQFLNLLVWNTYKAKRKQFWNDLKALTIETDISLLQESVLSEANWEHLHSVEGMNWQSAMSFKMNENESTGLTTGTRFEVKKSHLLASPVREPIAKTPKLSMLTELPIQGRDERLLVVNIHAINFVLPSRFHLQLEQLTRRLEAHEGPMIVAGDFNTHFFRRGILLQFKRRLGLEAVKFDADPRWLKLDHIFVKGLEWEFAQIHRDIKSSDHKPLTVILKIPE